jgi:rod shape-determining protein MreB
MIVDVGGGTTDIAVLSLNGVSNSSSVEATGDAFDEAIARHVRRKHGVVIGQVTAEEIKIRIGCVYPRPEDISMTVKGRDAKTGLPREILLYSSEIFEVLRRPARMITDEVLHVLEETSPELVGDIAINGITLTGGGSQIWGMDQLISERTAIPCTMADDPDFCVVYGCGKAISWINDRLHEGPIYLARERMKRE